MDYVELILRVLRLGTIMLLPLVALMLAELLRTSKAIAVDALIFLNA